MSNNEKELFVNSLETWFQTSLHTTMKKLHIYGKDNGLSFSQMSCLFKMKKKGLCQVKDVGRSFEISNPAASQMLDKLVKMDLVARKESDKDRRVKYHDLTLKGEQIIENFIDSTRASYRTCADDFDSSEYKELTRLLNKLTTSTNNRRNNVQDN